MINGIRSTAVATVGFSMTACCLYRFAAITSIALSVPLVVFADDTVIVDNFDGTGLRGGLAIFGNGSGTITAGTWRSAPASFALKTAGEGWGCVAVKTITGGLDTRPYTALTAGLKASPDTAVARVVFKLICGDGSEWRSREPYRFESATVRDAWRDYTVSLDKDAFVWDGGRSLADGGVFDPGNVTRIAVALYAEAAPAHVFIDDISLLRSRTADVAAVRDHTPPPFAGVIDDFDSPLRYAESKRNDVRHGDQPDGGRTGLDGDTGEGGDGDVVNDAGLLILSWKQPNMRWVSVLDERGADISENRYVVLRMRRTEVSAGLRVELTTVLNAYECALDAYILSSEMATVNVPLAAFGVDPEKDRIVAFALLSGGVPGRVEIDQIALSPYPAPNVIDLTFPGGTSMESGTSNDVDIRLLDAAGRLLTDFTGYIEARVTNGFIAPDRYTGFENGRLKTRFTVVGSGVQELIFTEPMSGVTD